MRRTRSRWPSGNTSSNDQPGFLHRRLGDVVDGDARFTAGRGCPTAALRLDQLAHGVMTGPEDLGRLAQRRSDDLAVDHHQAQVVARRSLLDQNARMLFAGTSQRSVEFRRTVHADGDALALFAAGRLDHDVADLVEERVVVFVERGQPPLGYRDPGLGDKSARQSLVVTPCSSPRRRCTPTTTLG